MHNIKESKWPVAIHFGTAFEKSATSGRYSSRRGIEIASVYTDPIFIIEHFATEGFDHTIKTLHHEYLHYLQDQSRGTSRLKRFFFLLREPKHVSLIQELHACLSENRLGTVVSGNTLSVQIENLKEFYGLNEKDIPKIESAFNDLKILLALGVDESDLARLVTLSRWNGSNWDMLSSKTTKEVQRRNLNADEIKLLIEIDNIRSELTLYKIKTITQKAIERFLSQEAQ